MIAFRKSFEQQAIVRVRQPGGKAGALPHGERTEPTAGTKIEEQQK